jgi:hypothetical protein
MVETGVGVTLTDGVGVGAADFVKKGSLPLRLSLPVTTAKKTRTTTRPKMKEIVLLRLSI